MARHGSCFIALLSITLANAFQAPPCARYRPTNAFTTATARRVQSDSVRCSVLLQPRAATMIVVPAVPAVPALPAVETYVQPILPRRTSASSMQRTVLAGAVVVAMMNMQKLAVGTAGWTLLAHACAGAVAGVAALFGDKVLSFSLGDSDAVQEMWRSLKFTAITKAVNSVTFAYIRQSAAALGAGSIMLGAAGTGIVATLVQGLFATDRANFFHDNVMRNVFVFEAFWLTYTGICAVVPAASVSYAGLAVSGALSGIASTIVASFKFSTEPVMKGGLRGVWRKIRQGAALLRKEFKNSGSAHTALQSGILFMVYQAVYTTLVA